MAPGHPAAFTYIFCSQGDGDFPTDTPIASWQQLFTANLQGTEAKEPFGRILANADNRNKVSMGYIRGL